MKIVFFGTPEFATKTLESLYESDDVEIIAVMTQPDKKVGRKKILTPPPVKVLAEELDLKVFQPKNKKELKNILQTEKAFQNTEIDFFVVIAYGMIIPEEILEIPEYGSINIHASLLPRYRGASPIQEALLNGDKETGITIMKMEEELDSGPIYLLRKLDIKEDENLPALTNRLAQLSSEICPLILQDIKDGMLSPIPQSHENATYCKKIKKEDGKIDWNIEAEKIYNMSRAYTPWPGIYCEFQGKKLKIISTKFEDKESNKPPGTFYLEDKTLKIATKKGSLLPQTLQIEGKKEMMAQDFANGYRNAL